MASFIPAPHVSYQIQPTNVYYLTYGDYFEGSIIDSRMIGSQVICDFRQLPSKVTIVHDETGELYVQMSE